MQEELNEFERKKVWTLVPRPMNRSIVGKKWVFRNKADTYGIITRNKSRMVVKGYSQQEDKALYGLKQAPRAWYETLAQFLLESGFNRGTIDKTLFYLNHGKDLLLVHIYVDDIIFGSTDAKLCERFAKLMQSRYQMSMMGELSYFLGLQVKQNEEGTFINQFKYTRNLLKKFGMQDCSTTSTPMATATKLDKDTGASVDITNYRGMIGSLLYLTYLKGTSDLGLWYRRESDFKLISYLDADFAGCKIDRKSTSGSFQFLGGRLVSWFKKKQKSISNSTAEAENIAAESCCAQILWMKNKSSIAMTDLYSDHHLDGTVTFRSSPLSSFALGEIFEKNDGDISGKIDASELREALVSLGFVVSPLDLLVSKFDKTGGRNKAIEYDNFIEYESISPVLALLL
ncbi:hypothetical protein AgCh_005313 [Apium graveolens]